MFLLRVCIGTCFKENIWLFVDSYSNPHWHRAPPHRLSQLSQYLNILDLGASPVQCWWCCWCCCEWVVSTAGYGKLTQCCCSGALQWEPPRCSQLWMGRDAVNISTPVHCQLSVTPGVWSQRPLPMAISDQWPDQRLGRDIELLAENSDQPKKPKTW